MTPEAERTPQLKISVPDLINNDGETILGLWMDASEVVVSFELHQMVNSLTRSLSFFPRKLQPAESR